VGISRSFVATLEVDAEVILNIVGEGTLAA